MIRVAIIEDNEYMREGWQTILDFEQDICVINVFESCEDAFESSVLAKADVILLDIQLPGMNGTEGVKKIKEKYPKAVVLMVTIHDDNERIFKALTNGAIGYLLKKVSPAELIEAVHIAHEGGSPMSPNIARKVINSFQKKADTNINLTDKETEILQYLAGGNSYKSISKEVYLSIDGVRYHIRNIYNKLEAKNRSEAISKGISLNLINPGTN